MELSEEERHGLGIALNEADLLGVEIDPVRRIGAATLRVLSLPANGPAPQDTRVSLRLSPVGRVVASLREARWDDPAAPAVPFKIDELLGVVQSFHGLPVYGWEFFDLHDGVLAKWVDRVSLDWMSGDDGRSHSIMLFQEAGNRILDLLVWFDDLEFRSVVGEVIPIDQIIADGTRWWDALYAGDPRTAGRGILPAGKADA